MKKMTQRRRHIWFFMYSQQHAAQIQNDKDKPEKAISKAPESA
ncbi:hypothetical protein [Pseudoalteromonas sp. MMG012]|nr:hypothetical protein [Pseudoalteromonas sp. MMG012]